MTISRTTRSHVKTILDTLRTLERVPLNDPRREVFYRAAEYIRNHDNWSVNLAEMVDADYVRTLNEEGRYMLAESAFQNEIMVGELANGSTTDPAAASMIGYHDWRAKEFAEMVGMTVSQVRAMSPGDILEYMLNQGYTHWTMERAESQASEIKDSR